MRQDWSRETLYNLSRLVTPPAANKTFFQQKWLAKSMSRAYHNPYVREGTWTRMFDRRLPAVVPMDHRYLALHDGSEMASGRGSGLEVDPGAAQMERQDGRRNMGIQRIEKTPYMHMTYHPLERRLDTAIWRALFASSTRQARQFVVHGWVKVNGKKMIYPGYQLNPGDMFQVEPERVMFATGARKFNKNSWASDQDRRAEREEGVKDAKALRKQQQQQQDLEDQDGANAEDSDAGAATLESDDERDAMLTKPEDEPDARRALRNLMTRAKRILDDSKQKLSGKRQQELRAFSQSVKKVMSKHRGGKDETASDAVEDLEVSLADIMSKIPAETTAPTPALGSAEAAAAADASSNPQMRGPNKEDAYKARKDAATLSAALERARANPVDASKPYATPWKPREFMSAFAFIPRYLEVNQNICSAVYLRHPVARPGLGEVPTPFHGETMALAFNWYLRRR